MVYQLGTTSLKRLEGVHPDLIAVTKLALSISKQDFMVVEGVRSLAQQQKYVSKGVSKTLRSRHLTGHAVDVVPWVSGAALWNDEAKFTVIAESFLQAAKLLNIEILWGRSWNLALNYHSSAEEALSSYLFDCKKRNKSPFLDGPHFQLTWKNYP